MKSLWRLFYAIKYWRVLAPGASAATDRASCMSGRFLGGLIVGLFLLLPILMGLGFGYLAWTHYQRTATQRLVDQVGVPVVATVFATRIEEVRHAPTSSGGERSTPSPSYFCHIAVTYDPPAGGEKLRKQFLLEDDTVCRRYKAGAPITGRLLPDNPSIMILDEGRLDVFWVWATALLAFVLAGLPLILLLRMLISRLAAHSRKKATTVD